MITSGTTRPTRLYPSYSDDKTSNDARAIYWKGLATNPGMSTSAWIPRVLASLSRSSRKRPSPRMTRRAGLSARTRANARNRVEKSFCSVSLPTARMTGEARGGGRGTRTRAAVGDREGRELALDMLRAAGRADGFGGGGPQVLNDLETSLAIGTAVFVERHRHSSRGEL